VAKPKYAGRRDYSEPKIVEKLREAGWEVHRDLPIDTICLKRVNADQFRRAVTVLGEGEYLLIKLLECKTARGKKDPKAVIDKRQKEQNEFCERWHVDKPTCAFEALLAVGEKVEIA
jgi:hypothetical protein